MVYDKIDQWVKPQRIDFHFNWFPMGPKLVAEPKGVILNIAPFNVPVFLLLSPLVCSYPAALFFGRRADCTVDLQVSAIAAGNGAVLKPSEQTPAFSQLIAELLPKYLDPELYAVINGGVAETTKVGQRAHGLEIALTHFHRCWSFHGTTVRATTYCGRVDTESFSQSYTQV